MTTVKNNLRDIAYIADLLRGPYNKTNYGRVVMPMFLLRYHAGEQFAFIDNGRTTTQRQRIKQYLGGDSQLEAQLTQLGFDKELDRLEEAHILWLIVSKFAELSLEDLSEREVGELLEALIHKYAAHTSGEYYTPADVSSLLVKLLLAGGVSKKGSATCYDPNCGAGGLLAHFRREYAGDVSCYGQEINPYAHAIATSLLGEGNLVLGDTLLVDGFADRRFDYVVANPPFGVSWQKQRSRVEAEAKSGQGRFVALPRVSDGSMLFLQHIMAKLEDDGRAAIIFSGSPMFVGGAGSGESEIRKWIMENDWLEAIVALPEQLFFHTGIGTYVWLVSKSKPKHRKGHVQLIDARKMGERASKGNAGEKKLYLTPEDIETVVSTYMGYDAESEISRVLPCSQLYTRAHALGRTWGKARHQWCSCCMSPRNPNNTSGHQWCPLAMQAVPQRGR